MNTHKTFEIAARLALIAVVILTQIHLTALATGHTTRALVYARSLTPLDVDSGKTATQGNPEKELLDIEDRMTVAYVSKNLEAYLQYIDPAVSAFHASNPYRIDDRQVVQEALGMFYKNTNPSGLYKLQPRVQLYGDTAVVTYHFLETGGEGPRAYSYEGKQTDVFVKKQGKWIMVHFHSSRQVRAH